MNYEQFLETKRKKVIECGFDVKESDLNDKAFKFQKYLIKRGLKLGRYGNYSLTGLGKTIMLMEWSKQVMNHTNKPVLILSGLGVSYQIIEEGKKFGYNIERFNFTDYFEKRIYITNYELVKNFTPDQISMFSGVALDEASILKNYTGKIRQLLTKSFENTPYRSCFSATPAANEIGEIGQQSEFLGILDSQDMRARWFVRDDGMNNYRLKQHAKSDFYGWMKSWSDMINSPSDLGFLDEGEKYKLPPINIIERLVDVKKQDNGKLYSDAAVSAIEKSAELRRTLVDRCEETIEIIKENKDKTILVWIELNDESNYIRKRLKELDFISFREVRGSDKPESKEKDLIDFAHNKYQVLITKKKIAGFGMNYQNCDIQIHVSPGFSFEMYYQALKRSHRFGRKEPVTVYMINIPTMENAKLTIERKQRMFEEMRNEMVSAINNKYGLVMDYEKQEVKTENYHIIKGDTTVEIDNFKDNSFDFSIFSPPFSMLFTYSNSYRDMGNCESHEQFFKQNQFLLDKLFRKMKPGSIVAVHSKDLAVYKGSSGYTGLYDFTGDYHRAMEKAGFKYHSKITIWTDPVLEMQRTKTQRLLYKQLRKDSKFTGVGLPEYLTIFKKWEGLEDYKESRNYKEVNNKNFDNFPLDTWQNWASPVWGEKIPKSDLIELIKYYADQNAISYEKLCYEQNIKPEWLSGSWFDIKRTDVLNNKEGTDMGDEKHIAPLQLTVIDRAIQMWTNKGDVVFTPFLGIGSEVHEAVKLDRFGCGIELKDSYFETASKNIRNVIESKKQLVLF